MVEPVKLFEFSVEEAISKMLVKECSHQAFLASQEIQVSIKVGIKEKKRKENLKEKERKKKKINEKNNLKINKTEVRI